MKGRGFKVVVIGVSAGGVVALGRLLPRLPADFPLPLVVVQHLHPQGGEFLAASLDGRCRLRVKQADEKEALIAGTAYLAPPNYHLLIEADATLSLSLEGPVRYSRPSVDVLFDSAVEAFGGAVIGMVLTGANDDGARGLKRIKEAGGVALVQLPQSADYDSMPLAALAATEVDGVLELEALADRLVELVGGSGLRAAGEG
ncbi:chemotaxis protein CheB [Endothiovibrio diazotrophicus]